MVFAIIKQFVAKEGTNMDGATFMLYMVLPLSSIGMMFSIAFCNIDFGNVIKKLVERSVPDGLSLIHI